jgi:hypothetical protein
VHYRNGRQAQLGDVVVGTTHNSNGSLRIGRVLEFMPQQGPCNVRLLVIGTAMDQAVGLHEDFEPLRFVGGQVIRATTHRVGEPPHALEIAEDFAECGQLVTVADAYKALNAIERYAKHDSPYFPAPSLDF